MKSQVNTHNPCPVHREPKNTCSRCTELEAPSFEQALELIRKFNEANKKCYSKYNLGLNGKEEFLALQEIYKPSRCPKCGIRVNSDEDALCASCI